MGITLEMRPALGFSVELLRTKDPYRGHSEQLKLQCRVDATQPPGSAVSTGQPLGPGNVGYVPGQGVKDAGLGEQLLDLGSGGGGELTQHNPRVTQQLGQFPSGIGAHGADLGERQRRQVQGQTHQPSGIQPGSRSKTPTDQGRDEGRVEDLPPDHAAESATGWRRLISSSPGQGTPHPA